MEELLSRFLDPDADRTQLLAQLVNEIRPDNCHDGESARRNLQALCYILSMRPDLRGGLQTALLHVLQTHRHVELYTSSGILPNTGFLQESLHRIGHTLLPEVRDPGLLRTVLLTLFNHPGDRHWVASAGEDAWLQLLQALRFDELPGSDTLPSLRKEIIDSLRVLSYWIAAAGMEPELLRRDPSLDEHESPFIAQNREMIVYIDACAENWGAPLSPPHDDRHLRVLLGQCQEAIGRIRKNAAREGTSIRLTFHLQRLRQLLRRSEQLVDILAALQSDPGGSTAYPSLVTLTTQLVREECLRHNLLRHWRQNIELIALRVTDNASQHGEHYITENRDEYWAMARSAMVGGCVIACMACLKILLAKAAMAPLTGAIAYCLNYGLGFCLIHLLHGTVATKQPAMTANAIAASISEAGGKLKDLEGLIGLIACTCRSQIVAILGNIGIAIPLAALIAFFILGVNGDPFTSQEKSEHLLDEQSLVHSGAVFYAAVAGLWLFVSGLISGYYDNYAAYNRIPERILQLSWPRRLLSAERFHRTAQYIGDNLGALAGNFLFGFLLGGTTLFGLLVGLPIDIRHVAFSSAFLGIALVGLDFTPDLWLFVWAVLGVAAIGFVNLTMSFALALNVALRSRQVSDAQWRLLVRSVITHLIRQPRDFFLPPRKEA